MNTRFNKILLIKPPKTEMGGYTAPPINLLYLAAFLKKNKPRVSINIVDGSFDGEEEITANLKRLNPDLVGITILTPGRHEGIRIAGLAKKYSQARVVLGGVHPTIMWKQMMEYFKEVDFVVRGEGEITLWQLVSGKPLEYIDGLVWRDKERGIICNRDRQLIKDLDSLPFPAWDMIDLLKYPPKGEGIVNGINLGKEVRIPIIFSRGCMGSCTFCSSWKIWKGYRSRSGKNVTNEIELLVNKYKIRNFNFFDDTLGGNRKAMTDFCQRIIRRRFKIALEGNTRVNIVNKKLLVLMKKAGFHTLAFGVESGSCRLLKKINKGITIDMIKKAFLLTKQAGIKTTALIMYGLPESTKRDNRLTEKLLAEIKPDGIGTVGETWIFPGTTLYEQAKKNRLINDRFWLGKKPCYIYRGGMEKDPVQWKLKLRDWLRFHFLGTIFDRIRIKILLLKASRIPCQQLCSCRRA